VGDGLSRAIDARGPASIVPCTNMGTQGVLRAASMDRRFFHRLGVADDLRARAAEWSPTHAARSTGLAVEAIEDVARLWASARPGFVKLGPGANHFAQSGQAFRAVLALPAATAAWRYSGKGAHMHTASSFADRDADMSRSDLRRDPVERTVDRTRMGVERQRDDIRALVVNNCNPAVVCPDSNAVARGLARDDLFTVVLELMPTDTVRCADVVLPATTQLEHLDVLWSLGHYYLSLNRPVIAPRDDPCPNAEISRRLDDAPLHDDETLLATYLDGYTAEQRQTLEEQGVVRVDGVTAPDAKVMLRNDDLAAATGLDPVAGALDDPHPGDGLVLPTPKSHHVLNSQLTNHERLRKVAGSAVVMLTPVDADEIDTTDGASAQLTSAHGEPTAEVQVSDAMLPGTAVLWSNWWHRDPRGGGSANSFTGQETADLGAAPVYTCACASLRWCERPSVEKRVGMLREVADRAERAKRDGHPLRLHRVADAGHDPGELLGDRNGLEVHAPAHADVARAAQYDGSLRVLGIEVFVGPAHEASLPRRVGERRGSDQRAEAVGLELEAPLQQERPVAPQTGDERAVARGRHLDVVLAVFESACGVRDAQAREVELVRAREMGVDRPRDRGAALREHHAGEPVEGSARVGAGGPRPPNGLHRRFRHVTLVVVEGHLEVVEVVLEPAPDDVRAECDEADAPPVRALGRADAHDGRAAVAGCRAHRAPTPGPPGYPPPPNCSSSVS